LIGALDSGLDYIMSHKWLWRATGSEIVEHFAKEVADE
jgi:hypothetical protein